MGSLRFNTVFASNFIFRGRVWFTARNSASISYVIGHVGDDTNSYPSPQQQCIKDGRPLRNGLTASNVAEANGLLTTTINLQVEFSDGGVYQCAFFDVSRQEIFIPNPLRVDTSKYSQSLLPRTI